MEQCTYGHIPEELAEANIQYIIQACNEYEGLKNKLALIAADRAGLVEALKEARLVLDLIANSNGANLSQVIAVLAKIDSALKEMGK